MAFIVFEGLDGSGKSTLIQKFINELESRGLSVVKTREPGGSPLAEEIRQLVLKKCDDSPFPRTELLLYQASRAQHVESVIRPSLNENKWVVSDRYFGSTIAFQVYGRKLPRAQVDWLNEFAISGIKADLTVLIDVPVEVSQSRIQKRGNDQSVEADRMESEKIDFHHRVREGYLAQAKESDQWVVIDGQLPPDQLFECLKKEMLSRGFL